MLLNYDCWLAIVGHIGHGDYRTLSRLGLTSKDMFSLTVGIMYGRLFDTEWPQEFENWSDIKKRRLVYLLLTSSGFLDLLETVNKEEQQQKTLSPLLSSSVVTTTAPPTLLSVEDPHFTFTDFATWRPVYSKPITIPYHQFLKRIPQLVLSHLVEYHREVAPPQIQTLFATCHASLMDSIKVCSLTDVTTLLDHVHNFKKLTVVRVMEIWKESQAQEVLPILEELLTRHSELFPGLLQEVMGIDARVLSMNRIIHAKNIRMLASFKMTVLPIIDVMNESETGVAQEKDIEAIKTKNLQDMFGNVSKLRIVSMARSQPLEQQGAGYLLDIGSSILKYCRQLEKLLLRFSGIMNVDQERIFDWAVKEWETYQLWQNQHPSQQPYQDGSCPSLVPLKSISFYNVHPTSLSAAMSAFRNTLQEVDFHLRRFDMDQPVSWVGWTMTCLTTLKLTSCHFRFSCLENCPVLTHLRLSGIEAHPPPSPGFCWKAPKQLKSLELSYGDGYNYLDYTSIQYLKQLQNLTLEGEGTRPASNGIQQIDISTWRLDALETAIFEKEPMMDWRGWRILRIAPNLKKLQLSGMQCAPLSMLVEGYAKATRKEMAKARHRALKESIAKSSTQDDQGALDHGSNDESSDDYDDYDDSEDDRNWYEISTQAQANRKMKKDVQCFSKLARQWSQLEMMEFRGNATTRKSQDEMLQFLAKNEDCFVNLEVFSMIGQTEKFENEDEFGRQVRNILGRSKMQHLCVVQRWFEKGFLEKWLEPINRYQLSSRSIYQEWRSRSSCEEDAVILPFAIFSTSYYQDHGAYRLKGLPVAV